jgi:hypothetical protein
MLAMIPTNFDVALVSQDDDASLFAARRLDIWHFVLATITKVTPNHQSIGIEQLHLPRYSVARALTSDGSAGIPELVQRLGIHLRGDTLSLTLQGKQYRLPEKLLAGMHKDTLMLKKAVGKVKARETGFEVVGAVTTRDFPVITEQQTLAEAIAFERETRKALQPEKFAVYSAFCTWRDFLCDDPGKQSDIARGVAKEMMSWDPNTISDEAYWESVIEIQEGLWGARIWGPGVDAEEDVLFEAFAGTFERLSSIQFAQFVLMNGMHRGGPFHALATLFDLLDFEGYKYWRAREFQPDSAEEQEIRTHSSFIELLGLRDPDKTQFA